MDQIKKIHASAREKGISEDALYDLVENLILIPSIGSLSKQEACYIIDKLSGKEEWKSPPSCPTEDEIPGGADLPTMKQVWCIRNMVKEKNMDREHFNNWMKKYRKITSIRRHNRKQASDTINALKQILAYKSKNLTADKGKGHDLH